MSVVLHTCIKLAIIIGGMDTLDNKYIINIRIMEILSKAVLNHI